MISMIIHTYCFIYMDKKKILKEHWEDFYGSACMGERGQIVVPKKLRDKLEIKKGDAFLVMQKGPAIVFLSTEMMEPLIANMNIKLKKAKK